MITRFTTLRRAVVLLGLAAFAPPSARSQGVPLVSMELTGGEGRHTLRTSHQYYEDGAANLLRAAATMRLWTPAAVAPVATIEYSTDCLFVCGDKASICRIAPDGGFFESFASPYGPAVSLGASATWQRIVTGTLSAGRGWYPNRAAYVDANIALAPFPHVGVVIDGRHIVTTDDRGDRVWLFPPSFGLRFF